MVGFALLNSTFCVHFLFIFLKAFIKDNLICDVNV